VVLDPVGVQASAYRKEATVHLMEVCQPDVIKGNAAEMQALRPVLSAYPGVAITTGEVDCIQQGARKQLLTGGSALMTQVTAMGCTAGALIAAFAANEKDPFVASIQAMTLMKQAGQEAITEMGLGTYRQRFIDCLSHHA